MIGIGLIVWEAYDFYNTCQEEGLDAAVLKLGFSLAAMAVGAGVIKRGYKLGTFFVETAPEALAHYKKIHPVFVKFYDIAAAAVAKGVHKVKEAAIKIEIKAQHQLNKAKESVTSVFNKGINHNYSYHPRIRNGALKDPVAHNFPFSFDKEILKVKPIKQSDGSLLYRMQGNLNSKDGFFEIGLNTETNTIFHRTFVKKQ